MRGRKPKPAAAHKADGTYRKHRHDSKPREPLKAIPAAPKWLTKFAAEKWREAGQQLVQAEILTELDLDALATYCEAWSTWRQALKAIEERNGLQTFESESGPKKHPAVQIAEAAHKTMLALQERLGLTPLARLRIRAEPGGEEKDALDEFMSGK